MTRYYRAGHDSDDYNYSNSVVDVVVPHLTNTHRFLRRNHLPLHRQDHPDLSNTFLDFRLLQLHQLHSFHFLHFTTIKNIMASSMMTFGEMPFNPMFNIANLVISVADAG